MVWTNLLCKSFAIFSLNIKQLIYQRLHFLRLNISPISLGASGLFRGNIL
jgi:hypothetical protein